MVDKTTNPSADLRYATRTDLDEQFAQQARDLELWARGAGKDEARIADQIRRLYRDYDLQDELETAVEALPWRPPERDAVSALVRHLVIDAADALGDEEGMRRLELPEGALTWMVNAMVQFPLLVKLLEVWHVETTVTNGVEILDGPAGRAVDQALDVLRSLEAAVKTS